MSEQKPPIHDPNDSIVLHVRCRAFEKRSWEARAAADSAKLSDWIRNLLTDAARDTPVLPAVADGTLKAVELAQQMRDDCKLGQRAVSRIRSQLRDTDLTDQVLNDLAAITTVFIGIGARFGGE